MIICRAQCLALKNAQIFKTITSEFKKRMFCN